MGYGILETDAFGCAGSCCVRPSPVVFLSGVVGTDTDPDRETGTEIDTEIDGGADTENGTDTGTKTDIVTDTDSESTAIPVRSVTGYSADG